MSLYASACLCTCVNTESGTMDNEANEYAVPVDMLGPVEADLLHESKRVIIMHYHSNNHNSYNNALS